MLAPSLVQTAYILSTTHLANLTLTMQMLSLSIACTKQTGIAWVVGVKHPNQPLYEECALLVMAEGGV